MPAPKTTAERTLKAEDKKKDRGLKKLWVWAYPEAAPKIRKYAKLLERELEERYEDVR